jgi:hypothetical protein
MSNGWLMASATEHQFGLQMGHTIGNGPLIYAEWGGWFIVPTQVSD